ncbi:MAG TPA: arginine--tRNA ligase [Candidatus Paceibacterota bacterium]|nr:arginine--tRNA ligase [Candidatus Paceibacterota bacterium]
MKQTIKEFLREQLDAVADGVEFDVLVSPNPQFGDYSTNIAFVLAKREGKTPVDVAQALKDELMTDKMAEVAIIEIAPNGFLNFFLNQEFLQQQLASISADDSYGNNDSMKGKTVMVEYTDPNPFKLFHIGHLMSNTIGETIARLHEAAGAKVIRANYQGDVGMHTAMAVWGMKQGLDYLGPAYAAGAKAYKEDPKAKEEIESINKKIYDKSDPEINELYEKGRQGSLDYFETVYKKLGTKFDHYFFESEVADEGMALVKSHPDVFVPGENGAIVFKGEDHGLHTRVFINSQGLPTYEAKELGLNEKKFNLYHPDLSIIVTANEVNEYFKVLLKAMSLVLPDVATKTKHIGHGVMRLPTGKMSSRTGDVVTADSLIEQTMAKLPDTTPEENREKIAVGAIKYSILKQSPGHDIIFDFEKSLAVKGDAGPYLQYTYARLNNIVAKAGGGQAAASNPASLTEPSELSLLRELLRFPDIVRESVDELAPQHLVTYLLQLTVTANQFYEQVRVLEESDKDKQSARLSLVGAVARTLKSGLNILGIETLDRI